MLIREELELEARRLDQRGLQLWSEYSREFSMAPSSAKPEAVTLFTFPLSTARFVSSGGRGAQEVHQIVRRIEYFPTERGPEFTLIEEESVSDSAGRFLRRYESLPLVTTDGAMEALIAGYQRTDEDRIRERIEPIAARIESMAFGGVATCDAVAEVEAAVADLNLSPSAQMRVRGDAIAFVEGRMEAGDFIARTASRQAYLEPVMAITETQWISVRIEVR